MALNSENVYRSELHGKTDNQSIERTLIIAYRRFGRLSSVVLPSEYTSHSTYIFGTPIV
jgi:hypothetical protein